MSDQPSIAVHVDGNWVAVPTDGDAPDDYGTAVVSEFGDAVPAPARDTLAADLSMFARRAQDSGAIFAAVMLAEAVDSVLAYTECLPLDPGSSELPDDVDAVVAELEADAFEPPGWQQVSRVELPVGPAARVHLLDADPGSVARGTDVPVVESVTHLVPVTTTGSGVALVTSWPALLVAEQLVVEADRLASTLTITP